MRMIPTGPSPTTRSAAEKHLFPLLEKADIGRSARCLHSLNLSEHEYKKWGEADFVIVSAAGILVLEVKGGRVSCADGIWTFTAVITLGTIVPKDPSSRLGAPCTRSRTFSTSGSADGLRQLPFGWGVVFPDIDFDVKSVEWPEDVVLDARRLRDLGIEKWIVNLLQYWRRKTRVDSRRACENSSTKSRLRFGRTSTESLSRARADQLHHMMEELTQDQYERFDIVEQAPRVLCEGGAGTGKTFLAAEVARREAFRGERVLLTCRSPMLAAFIASRLHGTSVDVVPVRGDRRSSAVHIADRGRGTRHSEPGCACDLDRLVVGGLAGGRWRIFYDGNNQSGLYDAYDPEAVEVLFLTAQPQLACVRTAGTPTRLLSERSHNGRRPRCRQRGTRPCS